MTTVTWDGSPVAWEGTATVWSDGEEAIHMGDMLVTKAELELMSGQTLATEQANLLITTATGVVQSVVGQRLLAVDGDELSIMGNTSAWLPLPERPVRAVHTVELDGTAVGHKVIGDKLWRRGGWRSDPQEPLMFDVVYDHGWETGHWMLEKARSIVFTLCANKIANPVGAVAESVDDYRIRYSITSDDLTEHAEASLISTYGGRADRAYP